MAQDIEESSVTRSFRLPDGLWESLCAEAKAEDRDCTSMLIRILRERYERKPKLEDKNQRGTLRK